MKARSLAILGGAAILSAGVVYLVVSPKAAMPGAQLAPQPSVTSPVLLLPAAYSNAWIDSAPIDNNIGYSIPNNIMSVSARLEGSGTAINITYGGIGFANNDPSTPLAANLQVFVSYDGINWYAAAGAGTYTNQQTNGSAYVNADSLVALCGLVQPTITGVQGYNLKILLADQANNVKSSAMTVSVQY